MVVAAAFTLAHLIWVIDATFRNLYLAASLVYISFHSNARIYGRESGQKAGAAPQR